MCIVSAVGIEKDALEQKPSSLFMILLGSVQSDSEYISPDSSLVLYTISHHTFWGISIKFVVSPMQYAARSGFLCL